MKRWLRATLPPDSYIGTLVVVYCLLEFLPRAFGLGTHGGEVIIHSSAIVYAAYRVLAFHPVFMPDYRQWLETTPWTSRLPLPLGPVHLVLQDAIVLGLLSGLAWLEHPGFDVLSLTLKFLFFHALCMALSFACLRMPWFAYAIIVGLGLFCLFWNAPLLALKVGIGLYSISYLGLRRALNAFDTWSHAEWLGDQQFHGLSLEKRIDLMKQKILGWPYDVLRPRQIAPTLLYRDGIMLSLLAGWWIFVVLRRLKGVGAEVTPVSVMVGFACHIALIARLGTYCWGYLPPINLWGRILTFRWIIPGYDRVFVAPLAAFIVMAVALAAFSRWRVPVEIAAPVTVTLVLLIILNLGPSLEAWRLTGKHRLSPAALMMNSQAEVKQL